jgi:hypothetical protein
MKRALKFCLFFILSIGFTGISNSIAAETSASHEYSPVEWSYRGSEVPETYWTPYLPLVSQQLTRFKVGFRFSAGTIAVKCPIKLTFKYDPTNAQSGKDLAVKIKAEIMPASYNTFESAFGLHLPNEFQIGFIGITALPDILPWYTLPWDLCEILGKIPGLPSAVTDKVGIVCSAIQNVGVNMDSKEALPLPGVKSFHDERTLMEVDLSEAIPDSAKQGLAIKLYNSLSSQLGSSGMGELLLMIRLAKNLANEDAARDFLTGIFGSAVDKLTSFATISVAGDPYFSVEGVELLMNIRMYIPGGKGSGTYPLVFTSSGQEQTVTFKDITPFIGPTDKLVVVVDSMTYRFKLKQGLTPKIGISLATIDVSSNEKYVSLASAKKDFPESEYQLEIPLSANTDIIQSQRVDPGCQSAAVNWASPAIPLKGKVKVFDGNTLVKTITESTYKKAHNVIVPGITPGKQYRFVISCVNESGEVFPDVELLATTKVTCNQYTNILSQGPLTLSNPSSQPGQNYIDFSWNTTINASTEIIISPAPDLSSASFPAIKREEGVIQGWGTQGGGERIFEASHNIRVVDLEPGTLYYYLLRSWDQADPPNFVGYLGQITTLPPPPPITTIIDALQGNTAMKNVPIEVWKQAGSGPVMTVTTGNDGRTPPVPLDIGIPYIMKIRNQECFKDADSSPITVTGDPYQEGIDHVFIAAAYKPPLGAYVFDRKGQPISGATATMPTPAGQTLTATTDANGYFIFTPAYIPPSSATVTISKQNYVTKQVTAKVEPCAATRKMTIENAVLDSVFANLNIAVKDSSGTAINGASVVIKEGNTQLASLSTNAQGKAVFTHNFNDNNANSHNLMIIATPAQASVLKPNSITVAIIGGSTQDAEIMCLKTPPAPAFSISNQIFSQPPNSAAINAVFDTSTAISEACLAYQPPTNVLKNTPWLTAAPVQTGTNRYQLSISEPNMPGGLYKIKIKVKNASGAQTETGYSEFNFTRPVPAAPKISNFKVSPETAEAGKNITVTAVLSDADSQLKKATLKLVNGETKIEKVLTTKNYAANNAQFSHTFSVTAADVGNRIILLEVSDEGRTTEQDYKITVVAPKEEKTIKEEAEKEEQPQKEVILEEKPIQKKPKKEELTQQKPPEQKPVEQESAQTNPSQEKTLLKFISKPSKAYVNKELLIKLGVRTLKGKKAAATCSLDWGDGTNVQVDTDAVVKHTYKTAGKNTIKVTASLKPGENFSPPQPLSAEMTVAVMPPKLTLTKITAAPGYKITIKAEEGSYPIGNWMLSFGDGKSETGQGAVSKSFNNVYASPGSYKIEFSVADSTGTVIKKSLNLIIVPKKPS